MLAKNKFRTRHVLIENKNFIILLPYVTTEFLTLPHNLQDESGVQSAVSKQWSRNSILPFVSENCVQRSSLPGSHVLFWWFTYSGYLKNQKSRCWSTENPHDDHASACKRPESLTVSGQCCGSYWQWYCEFWSLGERVASERLWPARSPDLSSFILYFWDTQKIKCMWIIFITN